MIRPPSIFSRWLMQRMNVVLPEPEGPMMQTVSPLGDVERDALQHLEPAEALVDVDRLA